MKAALAQYGTTIKNPNLYSSILSGNTTFDFSNSGYIQVNTTYFDRELATFGIDAALIRIQGGTGANQGGTTFNPIDGLSQISNMGTILFGGSGIGIQSIRQFADGQGPKLLGRALGFGTQRTAAALSNTLGLINKIGKYTGYAGQALNTVVYFNKVLDPNATLTTGDHVGFWTGTAVWGASLIFAANPIVLGGAVLYGVAELGSWAYNGKSIEQNIFDK